MTPVCVSMAIYLVACNNIFFISVRWEISLGIEDTSLIIGVCG